MTLRAKTRLAAITLGVGFALLTTQFGLLVAHLEHGSVLAKVFVWIIVPGIFVDMLVSGNEDFWVAPLVNGVFYLVLGLMIGRGIERSRGEMPGTEMEAKGR